MDKKTRLRIELNREQRERREQYKITYACLCFAISMENWKGKDKLKEILKNMEYNDPSLHIWEFEEFFQDDNPPERTKNDES